MQLHKLTLTNWRGVESRTVEFTDGITIIEGPNEIGKSTIIEALLTLIDDLDSSTKKNIKAVRPVGKDVGSSVEAVIESGPYHFTYSKTFNKSKKTELTISAPKVENVAGREAHDRATAILEETVDLDLWKALLVEQGEKIQPADLKSEGRLAAALDDVAGGHAASADDGGLYERVAAEYQQYYTPGTGREKFSGLEKSEVEAVADLESATEQLAEVEQDVELKGRRETARRIREEELPKLEKNVQKYKERKDRVDSLRRSMETQRDKLTQLTEQLQRAERDQQERSTLISDIAKDKDTLGDAEKSVEPKDAIVKELQEELETLAKKAKEALKDRGLVGQAIKVARSDHDHHKARQEVGKLKAIESQLQSVANSRRDALNALGDIKIDEVGLERLRKADNEVTLCEARMKQAATTVDIRAQSNVSVSLDEEELTLGAGDTLERNVTSDTSVEIPGVVSISVRPPQSAMDTDEALQTARDTLAEEKSDYDVEDIADAVAKLTRRNELEKELDSLKTKEKLLIEGRSADEITQKRVSMERELGDYLDKRESSDPLPETEDDAQATLSECEEAVHRQEALVETLQNDERELRKKRDQAVSERDSLRETVIRLEESRKNKNDRLIREQEKESDNALTARVRGLSNDVGTIGEALERIEKELDGLSPHTVDELYDNAAAALQRQQQALIEDRREIAIVDDRLKRAQADGRFEKVEEKQRRLDEIADKLGATRRRAHAAKRLWQTLSQFRDAARKSYLEPLKREIEWFGEFVYGADFAVELSDEWAIESVTRAGEKLEYEDLSIGTMEQLGILTRLAAGRIVSKLGGVPLIIDDALGFSDPERLEKMGAAIAAAGKECQIIILTCTPGRFFNVGKADVIRF